jgi:hypothetical protein
MRAEEFGDGVISGARDGVLVEALTFKPKVMCSRPHKQ